MYVCFHSIGKLDIHVSVHVYIYIREHRLIMCVLYACSYINMYMDSHGQKLRLAKSVFVHICVNKCMKLCVKIHTFECVYENMCIYMYICIYIHIYVCSHKYTYINICTYTYTYIYRYTSLHIYIHMYVYTYTYKYKYILLPRRICCCYQSLPLRMHTLFLTICIYMHV